MFYPNFLKVKKKISYTQYFKGKDPKNPDEYVIQLELPGLSPVNISNIVVDQSARKGFIIKGELEKLILGEDYKIFEDTRAGGEFIHIFTLPENMMPDMKITEKYIENGILTVRYHKDTNDLMIERKIQNENKILISHQDCLIKLSELKEEGIKKVSYLESEIQSLKTKFLKEIQLSII